MNRKEIADLLEIVISNYPMAKIRDAGAMVSAWEMGLGDYSAESVYKAARFHMETSPYFPTIADIRNCMVRAQVVYHESEIEIAKIEGSAKKRELMDLDGYLDDFCTFIGLGYPNDIED